MPPAGEPCRSATRCACQHRASHVRACMSPERTATSRSPIISACPGESRGSATARRRYSYARLFVERRILIAAKADADWGQSGSKRTESLFDMPIRTKRRAHSRASRVTIVNSAGTSRVDPDQCASGPVGRDNQRGSVLANQLESRMPPPSAEFEDRAEKAGKIRFGHKLTRHSRVVGWIPVLCPDHSSPHEHGCMDCRQPGWHAPLLAAQAQLRCVTARRLRTVAGGCG